MYSFTEKICLIFEIPVTCNFCSIEELTGDVTSSDLIVTTPEKWDGISRSWQTRSYVKAVSLIIIDEIHLLG